MPAAKGRIEPADRKLETRAGDDRINMNGPLARGFSYH